MQFNPPLVEGRLIERTKRFLARVWLDGHEVLAHCPNTGRLLGACTPGQKVWLSCHDVTKTRKLTYRWRLTQEDCGHVVGIDTQVPNQLFQEAFAQKLWPWLEEWTGCQKEVSYHKARFDFRLSKETGEQAYVEVKNVHYKQKDSHNNDIALFPDTPSERARKHLALLSQITSTEQKTFLIYIVQRSDVSALSVADAIDPLYAQLAQKATGVAMKAYSCQVDRAGITLDKNLPIQD